MPSVMTPESSLHQPPLVCHIIQSLDFGGLENGVVNLINWMPTDAYRHAIICLSHATDFKSRIIDPEVAIFEARKRPGKDFRAYHRVWQMLHTLKPAIVHTRNLPAVDMLFVARSAGIRHLVHGEHGLDFLELDGQNKKYNRLRRLTQAVVGYYICVSADLQRWLIDVVGLKKEKVVVIYNGVDTECFRPRSPTDQDQTPTPFRAVTAGAPLFVIGAVGRLVPVKDQLTLAAAFVHLLRSHPDLRPRLRLAIIGDGVLRTQIEETLIAGGVADLVWLPGFQDNISEFYRGFDLFVLPSLREGISNTALEAMASGLPVLATAVGGNHEILVDAETGFLLPPADPISLAEAIFRYVSDPSLLQAHAEAARRHTQQRFSPAAMVHGYRNVYDSLLRRPQI